MSTGRVVYETMNEYMSIGRVVYETMNEYMSITRFKLQNFPQTCTVLSDNRSGGEVGWGRGGERVEEGTLEGLGKD